LYIRGLFRTKLAYTQSAVARKTKRKRFRAVKIVKEIAREQIGAPPVSRVVPDRRKKLGEKHKPTLGKMLEHE
jgi:hypothetical protein